ncbi:BPSL0761 family protein [Paraburkholderia sabiae]|uniref:BPSL0761 family protein n=1 Tax=Paraburkholderia sabiae TaxID=273251 RepID=A0ABU9QNT5_9BURK|nr:BPSL0761 family protein [Paraburkholderia sabiae]
MTTPAERTRAVRGTRQFLETLASHTDQLNHLLVRTLAIQLLRHFPSDADLALSSSSLPTLWGTMHGGCSQASTSAVAPDVPKVADDRVRKRTMRGADNETTS